MSKVSRYGLPNSVGVTLEYIMVVGTLIFGGILDKHPRGITETPGSPRG